MTRISIENAALLRKAKVSLSGGFCALTGQTGAGKTVFVTALGLLKGDKAPAKIVSEGQEECRVTGLFTQPGGALSEELIALGLAEEDDDCVSLCRVIRADGRNRCYVNGKTVAMSQFRALGGRLLALHSQHETHALADPSTHLGYVDAMGDAAHQALWQSYQGDYESYRAACAALEEGEERIRSAKEKRVWLQDTVKELSAAAVKPKEEDRLWEKYRTLEHRGKLSAAAGFVRRAVNGSDKQKGAYDRVMLAAARLEGFAEILPELGELSKRLEGLGYELEAVLDRLEEVCPEEEENAEDLMERISARIQRLRRWKQKYSADEEELIALLERCRKELEAAQEGDALRNRLVRARDEALQRCRRSGEALQKSRQAVSAALSAAVNEKLKFLDMEQARFFVEFVPHRLPAPHGLEQGEFLICTNPGQKPAPVGSIASGGELSRIMLALKSVLAAEQDNAVLIFDEIDTGISGKTARKIGLLLRELSQRTQILAVTHSAQIASLADEHFLLEKSVEEEQTFSRVRSLNKEERVEELSRILGGIGITDAVRQNARELLEKQ